MGEIKKEKKKREFTGELFPKREDRNFENKRLKAYLRGDEIFSFGFHKTTTGYPVEQRFYVESGKSIGSRGL